MVARAVASPPTPEMEAWRALGLKLISQNKVACVLLAGGQVILFCSFFYHQGTRLGSTNPKGMFNLQLAADWTLFHVQGMRIARLQELCFFMFGVRPIIPW